MGDVILWFGLLIIFGLTSVVALFISILNTNQIQKFRAEMDTIRMEAEIKGMTKFKDAVLDTLKHRK